MIHCSMIGAPPIEITYLGQSSSASIGPDRPDRWIVAFMVTENDGAAAMSSCTFNGVAGTVADSPSMADGAGIAYANVPTGSTVSFAQSGLFGSTVVEMYMITGVQSGYYDKSTGAGTVNPSVPSGIAGLIMASRSRGSNGSTSASAGSGATNIKDNGGNFGGGGNPSWIVSHGYSDGSVSPVSLSQSGSFDYSCAVVFS